MPAATQSAKRTPYRIKAHEIEACNCKHGCNCQFGGFPNEGKCEFLIGLQVIDGHHGKVDLSGIKVVFGLKYPKAIHEGNGEAVCFIDQAASAEQVQALGSIFTGKDGGMPWEALAGTVTSLDGPILKPINMTVNGPRSSFQIPGVLDLKLTPLVDPVSGDEKEVHIVYPKGGFFWDDGDMATTETMRFSHGGIRFEHPSRYAATSIVNWTNQSK